MFFTFDSLNDIFKSVGTASVHIPKPHPDFDEFLREEFLTYAHKLPKRY